MDNDEYRIFQIGGHRAAHGETSAFSLLIFSPFFRADHIYPYVSMCSACERTDGLVHITVQ